LTDGVAEVEQPDGQAAQDDGEVEPAEKGAFVGEEDFGFYSGREGDAFACVGVLVRVVEDVRRGEATLAYLGLFGGVVGLTWRANVGYAEIWDLRWKLDVCALRLDVASSDMDGSSWNSVSDFYMSLLGYSMGRLELVGGSV
jgi:hypothetical protein